MTKLFAASGLEKSEVGEMHQLANSMGLFLQKTNIIRDYLEDNLQRREFWPREVWSKFALELKEFRDPEKNESAVYCMNILITNALKHVTDVIQFMSSVTNQTVFNFCAIPQTMAIATLALCYNNKDVFNGVVKIRKGEAVQLIMQSTNIDSVRQIVAYYSKQILHKIDRKDPSSEETRHIVQHIIITCGENIHDNSLVSPYSLLQQYKAPLLSTAALIALSYVYWYTGQVVSV